MFQQTLAAFTLGLTMCAAFAAPVDIQLENHGIIKGTLALPAASGPGPAQVPIVLMIAGSGPTDRNGNSPGVVNDSLQQLARALAAQGIASVRYDKRGIGASAPQAETALTTEQYADDAGAWLTLLKQDPRFNKVVVVGHSEGALIGPLQPTRWAPTAMCRWKARASARPMHCGASWPAS